MGLKFVIYDDVFHHGRRCRGIVRSTAGKLFVCDKIVFQEDEVFVIRAKFERLRCSPGLSRAVTGRRSQF